MVDSRMSRISLPLESVDYLLLQQEKMSRLQNQIEAVESHMFERSKLLRQIERLKYEEDARSERVLSRLNGRNFVLQDEIARLYGTNTALDYCDSPLNPGVLDNVLTHRTKEHSLAKQEKEMQIKYLMLEKRRLQEARERLHDKKKFLARNPTPLERSLSDVMPEIIMAPPKKVKSASSAHSVHSQGSYIRRAVDNLPQSMNRIWALRADIEKDYNRKSKPYNGHLGIESYKPHQLENYVIVRKIIEDFVDDCLFRHIIPLPAYNNSLKQRLAMDRDVGIWSDMSAGTSDKRIMQLVMEELVLEQTRKFSVEIVEDVLHLNGILRNLTDFTLMNQAERISTGTREGRAPDEPAYNTVTKCYFSLIESRQKNRKDIWGHTQLIQDKSRANKTRVPEPYVDISDNTDDNTTDNNADNNANNNANNNAIRRQNRFKDKSGDFDTNLITFTELTPMELKKNTLVKTDSLDVKNKKLYTDIYMRREVKYWQGLEADISTVTVGKKCKGIQTMKPSPDKRFMAVGTVHGDILVYDVLTEPWRVLRVVHNSSTVDDSVVDIAWTLDTSKLVTINKMGSMQVWTFDGGGSGKADAKGLEIQADSEGFIPQQLKRLVVLDDDLKEFSFKKGPFSDQGILDGGDSPIRAIFFPSFTFFGSQHSVCVGLDNGDLLKCNLEPLLIQIEKVKDEGTEYLEAPRIYQDHIFDDKLGVNLIGKNIEAELYRHHKNAVIYMCFIDNMSTLVTVDEAGFIDLWNYDSNQLSGFGWFLPFKKFKFDSSKTVYTPVTSELSNIKFTDQENKKKQTNKEIARERKRVDNLLKNMILGDPCHEEVLYQEGLKTSIYPPKGIVKEQGALFNVITRHVETDQLSTYLTRTYKPIKIQCKKLLKVCQSVSGQELIFLLLFPEFPPKGANITMLVFDLKTMELRDMRRDILLTSTEYTDLIQQDLVSCDVSRVMGTTGSDYLFITLNGKVRVLSLNTGKLVLKSDNTDRVSNFAGQVVDETLLPLSPTTGVTTISSDSQLKSVFYSQKSTTFHIMSLKDQNSSEERRMMFKSFQMWGGRDLTPVEMRVDPIPLTPGGNQPIETYMQELVLETVDKALLKKKVPIPSDNHITNRQQAYKAVAQQVVDRNIL